MSKTRLLFIILASTTIISVFLLSILGKRLSPILARYVNAEAKRFASNIVNTSVNDIVEEGITDDLFNLSKNADGKIEMLDYDTKKVNSILSSINRKIQEKLLNLEDGQIANMPISSGFKMESFTKNGIVCKVPMGSLRKNALFVNVGPSIPIKMVFIGQVESSLNTKVREYGINYLVVEINVNVVVEEQIIMPAMSKKETLNLTAPLTLKIIQGEIPNYYFGTIEKNSNINTVPIE